MIDNNDNNDTNENPLDKIVKKFNQDLQDGVQHTAENGMDYILKIVGNNQLQIINPRYGNVVHTRAENILEMIKSRQRVERPETASSEQLREFLRQHQKEEADAEEGIYKANALVLWEYVSALATSIENADERSIVIMEIVRTICSCLPDRVANRIHSDLNDGTC